MRSYKIFQSNYLFIHKNIADIVLKTIVSIFYKIKMGLTKKALLSLRLSPKSSFTISKLRFCSLRKP